MCNNKKKIAIVPGSFDPITYGHIDIVKRASAEYEKVYLAVMINPEKSYMFSLDERVRIAEKAINDLKNVEVISSEGMLWKLAEKLDADAIVKGYRNETDLEYEKKMATFNDEHCPRAKTVLLKASENLENISSTLVRNELSEERNLLNLLPKDAIEEINIILKSKKF